MAFSSQLMPNELIIHDTTPEEHTLAPEGCGRGLDLSQRTANGYAGVADPFPQELLIPRSEWQARIQEMEETKTRLSDLILQAGLPCKDQQQTLFCWSNAPTHCVEIIRVLQNQATVILSPASVACPINGFVNQGGWGKTALEQIVKAGAVPVGQWPANAIDRQYYTADAKTAGLNYRVVEWTELVPRNLDQLISMLLLRIPVAVGYNWWSHEVTAYDAVWLDGAVAVRPRNSWGMTYGDKGFFILQNQKMLPDDAVSPRTTLAA